jgi:hypothetical protein
MVALTQKSIPKQLQLYIQKKDNKPVTQSKTVSKKALVHKNAATVKVAARNQTSDFIQRSKKEQTRLGRRPIRQLTISWPTDTLYRSV